MKRFYVALLLPFVLAIPVIAGEAGITYTYQVLDGLAEGGARIERVYCLDHFAHSGMPTAFQLIAAPNIPPSNAPGPVKDVNLVSASGIAISLATDSNHLQITINAKHVQVPARFGLAAEDVLAALLEAIRQTAILTQTANYQVHFQANGELETYAKHLLQTFRSYPKSEPFWTRPLAQEAGQF
ncbi:MAG: hypothetical protein GWQ05_18860 [Verrucomicrobiaceae bacterium]|nr:hypothetical protein [Verrucomicrobiaceae bacterium]NCF92990.1 hypothetical protein [Verrucomicrobiaceae bacterium]